MTDASEPWVMRGVSMETMARHHEEISAIYSAHGLVVFPGLLKDNPDFAEYLADLRYLLASIFERHGRRLIHEDLGDIIAELSTFDPEAGRIVADLGTQPNKLVSINRIKFSGAFSALLRCLFGSDAVLATPQAGDTLHLFMPGERFHRHNLPIHQDYQYLMQSPRQATLYIGMSAPHAGVGGLEYWPGSQRLGVLKSTPNQNGSFEVVGSDSVLKGIEPRAYFWMPGDVAVFDSLMCHRSIPNTTANRGRVVQIMRYSDLKTPEAERISWQSTAYPRRGVTFQEAEPALFVLAP